MEKNNNRETLGKYWKDKGVRIKAKRQLLQSIGYQFPVAATLKKWGILPTDECRLYKKVAPDQQPGVETLGHIQRLPCP